MGLRRRSCVKVKPKSNTTAMTLNRNNIHPVFDKVMSRAEKEILLQQHAYVIWMTGLSGAGKTTIAQGLEIELSKRGFLTQILDGDNIRSGINNNLGFSDNDRRENIRRIAEVSKLFLDCGIICINSFISPSNEIRKIAYDIIGRHNVIEVYVNAPLEVCETRDVKGLYKKAREGKIKDFTGIDSPFHAPLIPEIELRTNLLGINECIEQSLNYILPLITFNEKF